VGIIKLLTVDVPEKSLEETLEAVFPAGGPDAVRVNPPENARLTFDHVVNDKLQEMIDSNFKFYKQITDDREFAKYFLDWLFERYLERTKKD
jgi:type I restriction enzyme R subunit